MGEQQFRVGQKVVCVRATNHPGKLWMGDVPTVGAVYTINGITPGAYGDYLALHFDEIRNSIGYRADRFRPIVERKTDISIFTEMLTKTGVDA